MNHTDEEIKKSVVEQLLWDDRVNAANVTVEADQGVVTLKGTVPTFFQSICAREDASVVSGVARVNNELEVRYPGILQRPTDEELRSRILSLLSLNPDIDAANIYVEVENGWVTLRGSVGSFWQKRYAEQMASSERGVIALRNLLSVVPTRDYLDRDIAEDIVRAIIRNGITRIEDIDVEVRKGVVVLTGVVSGTVARHGIHRIVYQTPGVVDLHDYLTVAWGRACSDL